MAYLFPMEHQQQTNWCWAAVTVSVDHYFKPGSPRTQQNLAEKELPLGANNVPWVLDKPLRHIGALRGQSLQRPLTFAELQRELLAKRPVCARIEWEGGGAHFVVISGFATSPDGVRLVYVSDPLLEESEVVVCGFDDLAGGDFSDGYGGDGRWVETYLLQPPKEELI
jgi:hypothetical protein